MRKSQVVDALRAENDALKRRLAALENYRVLAYRDAMTGLWNRRYFDERLAEEVSRASRGGKRPFSVLLVDVNDLKVTNDQLGHAAGDEAIAWAATFLRETMRAHDVCCRIGGDEFGVILPEAGTLESAKIVQRLTAALQVANAKRDRPIWLAFGSATWPADGGTSAAIVQSADAAMYRDKRRQKTRAVSRLVSARRAG